MYPEFLEISRKTGVPAKKVLDVFYILQSGKLIENNELLRAVGLSRNALNQVKKGLSHLLKSSSKSTELKTERHDKIQAFYTGDYQTEEHMWSFLENDSFRNIVELSSKYKDQRPSPKRRYDQFTATIETTARRASLLSFFEDIRGKRLLFIGDDDFTSVAVASLKGAESITVVDIDERILKAISKISDNRSFKIETIKYDARKTLPGKLRGRFDIVFTDPPYTPEGMKLFISRGIEALDSKNKAARIYACYGNSDRAKERFLPIYEIFADSGLMIRWVLDKFNRYQGAESIGSSSALFITEVTPKTKPVIKGNYDRPIYTNN